MIKIKDIKNMKEKELNKKLKELKLELVKVMAPNSSSKVDPKEIKKAIARIKTIKNNTQPNK